MSYLCRTGKEKTELRFQQFGKHIYSIIEFGKQEMSFHFERWGKKGARNRKISTSFFFTVARFSPFVANEWICQKQTEHENDFYKVWKYAELINFPFVPCRECDSFRFDLRPVRSAQFDSMRIGIIWFVPFNHLLEKLNRSIISGHDMNFTPKISPIIFGSWSIETVKKIY